MEKICNKCKIKKTQDNFNKNKSKKDNLDIYCKVCVIEKNRKYNPKKIKPINVFENSRICLKCNEEKSFEYFSKNNSSKTGVYTWCKECVNNNIKSQDWYKEQYSRNKEYKIKWEKEKYTMDLNHKLRSNLRCRVNSLISKNKIHKDNSSLIYLGCSLEKYKSHIQNLFKNGMNWENHGEVWEVDHIFPLSKFDLTIEENMYIAFNYKNTQPLFKTTDIAEGFGYNNIIGNRNKKNKI